MRPRSHLVLAALLVLLALCRPAGADQDITASSLKFFRDLAETRDYSLGKPVAARFTPDGRSVIFLRGGARDPVLRLYEMEVETGAVREVLTPDALLKGAEERLSVEERARRERMRMTLRGFTSFELSEDGSRILVPFSGKVYVVRRPDGKVTELPGGAEGWIDPRFSPDGKHVAAVRGGELYVIDPATATQRRITTGATETLTHGLAEYAAQEEMDRDSGYWWSPDSSKIVFQETDLAGVERLYIMDPFHPERPPEPYFYPRAGKANAAVRLGIVARDGGPVTWIRWDPGKYPYLARVQWKDRAPLTLLVQTRDQREEKLLAVDPATGACRELLTETDGAWLNLDGDLPEWLPGGREFLWTTEKRGSRQLELRAADGELVRELTPVTFNLSQLVDADGGAGVAVVSGGPDPRETHLYRVSFRGGDPVRLTEGAGIHSATFSKDHGTWLHFFQLLDGRVGARVKSREGRVLSELPSVAEQPPFLPEIELTRAGGKEGLEGFDAVLIRPRDFRPGRKYPVILDVYGGPGAKVVRALPRAYLRDQWMADHGYIVVSLDGRGTPGRGREWERAIQGNLIDVALEDQVAGLRALGERYPELDLTRVGVTGWSFGGYFTAMATIRRGDVFRCGVAGAPVTDWTDYDTHYTERYMGLPSANPEGYRKASVLTYASELARPLLLIHGLTDDNVYAVHTLKLADALFRAGRPYDLLPLTGTHLITDPRLTLRLHSRIMDYFNEHMGEPPRADAPGPDPASPASGRP